jgi:hypothetical protein
LGRRKREQGKRDKDWGGQRKVSPVGKKGKVPEKIRQKRERIEEKGKTDFPRTYTGFQKTAGAYL